MMIAVGNDHRGFAAKQRVLGPLVPTSVTSCPSSANATASASPVTYTATFTPVVSGTGNGLSGAYFANETLTGTPALSRIDATVNFDWAKGSPGTGIAGDRFSAADVYVGAQIGWGLQFRTIERRPAFEDYVERVTGRPAYARALANGGPYTVGR